NKVIFDKKRFHSYLQVIFKATYWARFWSLLQKANDKPFMKWVCRALETMSIEMAPEDRRRMLIVQAAALLSAMYALLMSRIRAQQTSRPQITYAPMSAMDAERKRNLDKIYNCNDVECVNMLRMRRAPFFHLCNLLRERNLLRDSIHSIVEEQVAMFLYVVGHNQRFKVIHQNWRRSVETVSRYFKEVLYAIGELRQEMIKAPACDETPIKIRNSARWYPYFKDCIGAIDETHIHARLPAAMQSAFRGRKHYTTQNVLAAVDFDLKFTYVLAGWEGSAHDAVILADALEKILPSRCWVCMPTWIPSSLSGTRYHLKEYGGRNYPTNPRELFNLRHSSLRVTVERAFGALKNRFRILDNKPFHPFKTQVKLVLTCCILHNWILGHGVDEVVPMESTWEPNNSSPMGHGVPMDDNSAWATIRDQWANQMWANKGNSHEMAERNELALGDAVEEVAAVANQQARPAMRWTNVMSSFVLRRMCQFISSGVRADKGFKEVHLNQVAKALHEFTGHDVTGTQAHPKDAEYLNKPIENYQQMQMIFGNGLATGKWAMGSNEALGSPSDFAESSLKGVLGGDGGKSVGKPEDLAKLFEE
ncbi:hypothetical protein U9M48_041791, partial [Paspalum notatum var. saurae]